MFLYCKTSTLKPMVGIVWIFSSLSFCNLSVKEKFTNSQNNLKSLWAMVAFDEPHCMWGWGACSPTNVNSNSITNRTPYVDYDSHNIVVFPALSSPNISILTSFDPNKD